ncbi:group II intron reverse transcriptase/maturase, partial [Tautonia marina]|uniref:group II intron reverse transcriptase/maturase n=1 Tax=Tautonia marina TaxID=2653855 RepID=UPI0012609820
MEIGERQRKLSEWSVQRLTEPELGLFASRKDLRLYDLYHLVYEPTWLRAAHDRVARNSGSKTAGCDGITMGKFDADLEGNLRKLAEDLRSERFEPHPVRRVHIPKRNGKLRPLGIPSIRDRIVQESVRMILEPIFEAEFYNLSFGFRPNRSTIDALATILHRASNKGLYHWVIEGDIKSCFDKILHRKLIGLLRRRIRDKKLLRLVWRFLRAGVMEGSLFAATQEGTPQGGIISPLLANVYLHKLDRYLERRTRLPRAVRQQRRREGRANFVHIRDADDFVVMCNGTRAQAEAMKRDLQEFLSSELKLELSEEKTRITHVNDGFRFLGFDIRREMTGTRVRLPKLLIPDDSVREFRAKVLAITARSTCNQSIVAKLGALNSYLRGWGNHYRY